jgi:putative endonuclease
LVVIAKSEYKPAYIRRSHIFTIFGTRASTVVQKSLTMNVFYVYVIASKRNGTLYVGSTSDLIKQLWEHKAKVIQGFTAQYNVHLLGYYETHSIYPDAARREKRFKNWCRQWEINLFEELNRKWSDLYEEICS